MFIHKNNSSEGSLTISLTVEKKNRNKKVLLGFRSRTKNLRYCKNSHLQFVLQTARFPPMTRFSPAILNTQSRLFPHAACAQHRPQGPGPCAYKDAAGPAHGEEHDPTAGLGFARTAAPPATSQPAARIRKFRFTVNCETSATPWEEKSGCSSLFWGCCWPGTDTGNKHLIQTLYI